MNSSHERVSNGKDEWLTPPDLVKAVGPFDLDPCSPVNRPWDTAREHYTIEDDGLSQYWMDKFVWCNPPYGTQTKVWLERMVEHDNGIALIFARTDTRMFFDYVWNKASCCYFLKGRLKFHHVDGTQADSAGAPSVLIGYGDRALERLKNIDYTGKFIELEN